MLDAKLGLLVAWVDVPGSARKVSGTAGVARERVGAAGAARGVSGTAGGAREKVGAAGAARGVSGTAGGARERVGNVGTGEEVSRADTELLCLRAARETGPSLNSKCGTVGSSVMSAKPIFLQGLHIMFLN